MRSNLNPSLLPLVAVGLLVACPKAEPAPTPAPVSPATTPDESAPGGSAPGESAPAAVSHDERAKQLAQEFIIVDGHVDLPYRLHAGLTEDGSLGEDPSKRTEKGDFDAERARAGGLNAPFMSIYVPAKYEEEGGAKKLADELIDLVEGLAKRNPETFVLAKTPADVRAAKTSGKIAFPMGMENGSPIEKTLKNLEHFHSRGIRYITLAHSKDNHISDSSYDDRHTSKGLTPFGREVVAEMNRLGIFVDVSHLSDDAITQVTALSKAPVIASHSSCRKFTPGWERNISDELIKKVAATGGVVQINFGSTFISDEARKSWNAVREIVNAELKDKGLERGTKLGDEHVKAFYEKNKGKYATVEDVADHVEHVIKLVGVAHVGLGSDYDGVGDSLPVGLKDVSQYPNLFRVLLERGHSEEDIKKIAGENVLLAWQRMEEVSKELSANPAP